MAILRINAGPGCGKSHVLANIFFYIRAVNKTRWEKTATAEQLAIYEWCDKNLPAPCKEKSGYFAYNTDIVEDMKTKVHRDTECKTAHGWGYSVLNKQFGFLKINHNRSAFLVSQVTGKAMSDMGNSEKFKWLSVIRHIEKMKDELLDANHDNFLSIHNKYSDLAPFPVFDGMEEYAAKLLKAMKVPDTRIGIEHIDQVWLALFTLKSPILPLGLIDEDQDLSPARLLLARKLFQHLIFCGDENQAINAFSGADPESVNNIRAIVDEELPMKESFRNPQHICNYLNALTPGAKLRPYQNRSEGVETRICITELASHLKKLNTAGAVDTRTDEEKLYFEKFGINFGLNEWEQTLILCRYNAPLVQVCMELIKANIPCYILGNTLIDDLCNIIKNRNATSMDELEEKLNKWLDYCTRNANEIITMQICDKVDCIKLVMQECNYPEDVIAKLKTLLKPKNSRGLLRLSTIHRAKGLQAKHIFILYPPIEHPKVKTDSEAKQEKNLHFVAVSRSSRNLTWIQRDE